MKLKLAILFLFSLNFYSQVGIGTIAPKSTLDVNGNVSVKTITLIGSPTATIIDEGFYISVNPQVTNQEFNLPSPIDYPGRIYFIRNINNTVTAKLSTPAGFLFHKNTTSGGATEIFMYENNRRSIWVISDGLNWTYFD